MLIPNKNCNTSKQSWNKTHPLFGSGQPSLCYPRLAGKTDGRKDGWNKRKYKMCSETWLKTTLHVQAWFRPSVSWSGAPPLNYHKAPTLVCQGVWREVEDKDTQLQASLCLCRAPGPGSVHWCKPSQRIVSIGPILCLSWSLDPASQTVAHSLPRVDINTRFSRTGRTGSFISVVCCAVATSSSLVVLSPKCPLNVSTC